MIDGLLIEQEAKKSGISVIVKDADVMAVIQDVLTKQKLSMQDFLKNLDKEGNSIESVKKEIRGQLVRMRLLRREVKDKVLVSDEEIWRILQQNTARTMKAKKAVRMKQLLLLLPPDADKNYKNENKK